MNQNNLYGYSNMSNSNNNARLNVLNNLREIITGYNNVYSFYNLNLTEYNRNMTSIIRLLDNIYNTNRNINRNSDRTFRRRSFTNEDDLYSSLILRLTSQLSNNINLNSPTNNGLTEEQIEIHTRTIRYTPELTNSRCPITLTDFEENEEICQIINCGHYFKTNAIRTWLERNNTCPSCRRPIISDSSNNTFGFSTFNNDLPNLRNTSFNDLPNLRNTSFNDSSFNTVFTSLIDDTIDETYDTLLTFSSFIPPNNSNNNRSPYIRTNFQDLSNNNLNI